MLHFHALNGELVLSRIVDASPLNAECSLQPLYHWYVVGVEKKDILFIVSTVVGYTSVLLNFSLTDPFPHYGEDVHCVTS